MGLSLVELANDALATLGEQPIVNLNPENATSTALLINMKYPLVWRSILMEADWNCARRTQKLSKIKDIKNRGYKYTYQLPTDPECLHVQQISVDDGETYIDLNAYYNWNAGPKQALFDIEDGTLVSNSETVWIKYTALIDPAEFDPFLAAAFSARLAAELAYAIPASAALGQYLAQEANRKLKKAKSRNALDRNIVRPTGEVVGVRYFNGDSRLRVDMSEEKNNG